MLNHFRNLGRWLFVTLILGLPALSLTREAAAAGDKAAQLRYRWKAGQTYAYTVTVEVDQGDYLDILSGTPTYTVAKADQDGFKLSFRGALAERKQVKPGKRVVFGPGGRTSPFSPFTGVGAARASELTINDRGEILSAQGTSQLPYLLGNLAQLMIDPLPKESERTWKTTKDLAITLAEGRVRRPVGRNDDRKVLKAVQETNYTIEQATNDKITISKLFELKTGETVNGKPRFEITGEGKLVFDAKAGVPATLEFQQKLFTRDASMADETVINVTFKLLDEAERAKLSKSAEGAVLFPGEPLDETLQTQALADLKSGDKARYLKAMVLLQSKDSAKPNKELAHALETFLVDKDSTMRFSASRALMKWATPETAAGLVKALADDNISVRHNAMDALGRLKVETEAIADRLTLTQDRFKASLVLQAIGPEAESAVLKHAENKDWQVRSEVCKILKVIGSKKSVLALTTMQSDSHALVKLQAKQALDAIASRK